MASPGLVLLLLMSSSLLVSTVNSSPPGNEDQQQQLPTNKLNRVKENIIKHYETIRSAISPFVELIPVCGPLINAILTLVGVSAINKNDNPELETLKFELYHMEQKWDTWASAVYSEPERKIKESWTMYNTLANSLLLAKDDNERQRHKDAFMEAYIKYEPATKSLYHMLSNEKISFSESLENLLPQHVKCHEKSIRDYTVFIGSLIHMGNTLNQFYYKLKNIESKARVDEEADITYKAASVMFRVHKTCVIRGMDYVKKDVEELIDTSKKREELAKEVRLFLEDAYDRYDWMVVAFQTKKSSHEIIETLNHHAFLGFTEVKKGGVSVAVARQVKGTHTMGKKVKEAINRCISESDVCYQVAEKLSKCSEMVDQIRVSQTFTAVHAYLRKAHDSHSAQEAPVEDYDVSADPEDNDIPYISTGKCSKSIGVKGGKFVVFIKSDEEMLTIDPCSKLNCGPGKCVRVENTFRAMCECDKDYYGQMCEQSLEEYKKSLAGEACYTSGGQ